MRHLTTRAACLALALFAVSHASAQDNSPLPQGALAFGEAQERDMTKGEVHAWTVDVEAGQYVEVAVDELGLQVMAVVRDPAGTVRYDGGYFWNTNSDTIENLRWVADAPGTWSIEVRHVPPDLRRGRYRMTWSAHRVVTAADEPLLEADRLEWEAFTEAGNNFLLGCDRACLETVTPLFERSLALREAAWGPVHPEVARSLLRVGQAYLGSGRYRDGPAVFERALAVAKEVYGPETGAGGHLDFLTFSLMQVGRYREAEVAARRNLRILERFHGAEAPILTFSLGKLSTLLRLHGRYAEAEAVILRKKAFDDAYPEWVQPGSGSHYELGRLYQMQGRFGDAEAPMQRVLALRENAYGARTFAAAIARVYLSGVWLGQGRLAEADSLARNAVALMDSLKASVVRPAFRNGLETLGDILTAQGRYAEADQQYMRILTALEAERPDEPQIGRVLLKLSRGQAETGQDPMPLLDRAAQHIEYAVGLPEVGVAVYAARAEALHTSGDLDAALDDLDEAIYRAEGIRTNASGGEVERAKYFRQFSDHYDRMIAWQIESGDVETAFEYAERGRSRVLLDQLAAGKVDLRRSIDEDILAPLEAAEHSAQGQMASFQFLITQSRARTDLDEGERLGLIAAYGDSLRAADSVYTAVYNQIKNASPLWRDQITSGGSPARLRDIQRQLLGRDGLMLSYEVGREGSYVFVIGSRGTPEAVPLMVPEEAARVLGVEAGPLTEEGLARMLGAADGAAGVIGDLSTRGARVAGRAGFSAPDRLHALWQTLVPETLWAELLAAESVVLVPDAMLHMLPFEALVTGLGDDVRYWLDDGPAIRYAPSATALFQITDRPDARMMARAGAPDMLSLSDPIYDPLELAGEERGLAQSAAADTAPSSDVATRNSFERAGGSLMRLPGTALETVAIGQAMTRPEEMVTLQGAQATEPNLRAAVDGKRFLHLATHGIVDASRGELFASLAMTPPSDAADVTIGNDGYLTLAEIYDLELDHTELAVLSACDSNVGPEVEGEGVFALSRGFLAAGARRVVASQWAVDDASTADLVSGFFSAVLTGDQSANPADYAVALRDAKREVRNQDQWSDPYYWAPFVLAGKR